MGNEQSCEGKSSMALLSFEEMIDLQTRSVEHGFAAKRQQLLAPLNPKFVAGLEIAHDNLGQVTLDLSAMNHVPRIEGNVIPLLVWLLQAKFLSAAFPERQSYYENLAERVAKRAAAEGKSLALDCQRGIEVGSLPERIIYKNDLLSNAFIFGAARSARSVARIRMPQFENAQPRLNPSSGQAMSGYGTGWMIGPQFIITNWHVIEARAPGETTPAITDVREQCKNAVAEFDYDGADTQAQSLQVAELAHGDLRLDYAVLRLADNPDRQPLPLRREELSVNSENPFPVNVIQHPGGGYKQFGIRNNLVAALKELDLAYFTDTAGGSSGSPVCDDLWRVIALHKASTLNFGLQNFQGKTTAWVNIGTPIRLIIQDLEANKAALWREIGATLV
jgi:hypothetical protein